MVSERFARLGARLFGPKALDPASAIKVIERLLPISDPHRRILLAFGGAIVFDNGAMFKSDQRSPLSDKQGYLSLEIFYGVGSDKNSIERKSAQYSGEVPGSFVPIGESSGGN